MSVGDFGVVARGRRLVVVGRLEVEIVNTGVTKGLMTSEVWN